MLLGRRVVVDPLASCVADMPYSCLTGRLGEIYQQRMSDFAVALAWPALLTAAGALVRTSDSPLRANLFTALVGDVNCGKSSAIEWANFLLDVLHRPSGRRPTRLVYVGVNR